MIADRKKARVLLPICIPSQSNTFTLALIYNIGQCNEIPAVVNFGQHMGPVVLSHVREQEWSF